MATQVNAVKPTTIALNLAQNNTVTERRVYRVLGRNGTIMRSDGKRIEFIDGWLATDIQEDIEYLDHELKVGGFGPSVRAATQEDLAEYSQYVDPASRQVSDLVAQLAMNPAMAMQLAQALNGSKDEGAQALSNTLASNAEKALARKITVGGKGPGLGGITSSQTIATVSNGSNSELAPPPMEPAGK